MAEEAELEWRMHRLAACPAAMHAAASCSFKHDIKAQDIPPGPAARPHHDEQEYASPQQREAAHQGLVDARWPHDHARHTHRARPKLVAHMHAALGLNYTLKSR